MWRVQGFVCYGCHISNIECLGLSLKSRRCVSVKRSLITHYKLAHFSGKLRWRTKSDTNSSLKTGKLVKIFWWRHSTVCEFKLCVNRAGVWQQKYVNIFRAVLSNYCVLRATTFRRIIFIHNKFCSSFSLLWVVSFKISAKSHVTSPEALGSLIKWLLEVLWSKVII